MKKTNKLAKRLCALLLAVVMLLALAACGGETEPSTAPSTAPEGEPSTAPEGEPSTAPEGDDSNIDYEAVVTMALTSGWSSLIPYNNASDGLYGMLVMGLLQDMLVLVNPDGSIEPRLAKSWEGSDDHMTATFYLDETATWHDGEPVTAEDFVFTVEMLTDPDCGANYKTEFDVLAGVDANGNREEGTELGVKALDEYTVQFTFDTPTDLEQSLCNDIGAYYPIPKHLLEDVDPADYLTWEGWNAPMGCGPYIFESTVPGNQLVVNANENYHLGRPGLGQLVVEYMAAQNIPSALISEDIDISFPNLSSDDVELCSAYDYLNIWTADYPTTPCMFVMANTYWPDHRVRQAFNYALDRETICTTLGDNFEPIGSPVFPDSEYYNEEYSSWEYNPDKALEILKECEADGTFDFSKTIEIYTPAGDRTKAATVIQQNLQDLGLTVEIVQSDSATMFGGMVSGEIGIGMANFSVQPHPMYFSMMTSNESPSYVMADIPLWDELKAKMAQSFTDEEKQAVMDEYQEAWAEYQPSIFYAISYDRTPYNARLGDNVYYTNLLSNAYYWPCWKLQVTK